MRWTLPLLVAVLALGVAGCGGGTLNGAASSSTPSTAPPPTSPSAPSTTPTTHTPTTTAPARTGSTTAPATTPAPRTTPGVPNAAFAAQANGVCARADKALGAKLKQHPEATSGRDIRAAVQLLIPAEQARIAALKALAPPASIGARYGQFIAALQARLAQLQRLESASPGKALPRSSVLTLQGGTQRVAQLGASLGLDCAG